MIKKVQMFTVICDNCGQDVAENSEYSCWNDESYANENAMESGWDREGDKHYCDLCWRYDDNDNIVVDPARKDLKIKKVLPR